MGLTNISPEVTSKIIGVLEEEKIKLKKSIEDIETAIAEFKNGKPQPPKETWSGKVTVSTNIRGSVGWKYKIAKVMSEDKANALTANDIVAKICAAEPSTNPDVAKKSVGSALSQNSNSSEPSKNRYLFIKKQDIKYYYLNKDYNINE